MEVRSQMSYITSEHRRIHYRKQGNGPVTVLFESGIGGGIEDWNLIQPVLAEHHTTVSYTRAGNGLSDAYSEPYTLDHLFSDFLEVTSLCTKGPFILVGHSFGGGLIKHWAYLLDQAISGLCFIDPSDYQYSKAMMSYRTEEQKKYWKTLVTPPEVNSVERISEQSFFQTFLQQIDSTPFRSDIATQIIACDNLNGTEESIKGFGLDPKLAPASLLLKDNETWESTHRDWLNKMPQAHFHLAEGAGHYINRTKPQLIIDCIKELINRSSLKN